MLKTSLNTIELFTSSLSTSRSGSEFDVFVYICPSLDGVPLMFIDAPAPAGFYLEPMSYVNNSCHSVLNFLSHQERGRSFNSVRVLQILDIRPIYHDEIIGKLESLKLIEVSKGTEGSAITLLDEGYEFVELHKQFKAS